MECHPHSNFVQDSQLHKYNKVYIRSLGHKRYVNGFAVKFSGHLSGFRDIPTVHEPEASGDRSGKTDAVVDEGEWCRASDVFPLRSGRAAWKTTQSHDCMGFWRQWTDLVR